MYEVFRSFFAENIKNGVKSIVKEWFCERSVKK